MYTVKGDFTPFLCTSVYTIKAFSEEIIYIGVHLLCTGMYVVFIFALVILPSIAKVIDVTFTI